MIGNFFLRNNIEENVAQHLILDVVLKKINRIPLLGGVFISKMDMKNVKIWLNLAIKIGISSTFR
jgi:hypothetical protein